MKWVAECYSTPKKLTSISKIEIETIPKRLRHRRNLFFFQGKTLFLCHGKNIATYSACGVNCDVDCIVQSYSHANKHHHKLYALSDLTEAYINNLEYDNASGILNQLIKAMI